MLAWRGFACLILVGCAASESSEEPTLRLAAEYAEAAGYVDVNGLHVESERILNARLRELTFSTSAVQQHYSTPPSTATPQEPTPAARILLPSSYQSSPDRRYPVLYLLHGGNDGLIDSTGQGSYKAWTAVTDPGAAEGDAQGMTEGLDLIVVMPEGAHMGWYSDWFRRGTNDTPRYEEFHVKQLIAWVDANFRTLGSRSGRAIAGLSMGGFGAFSYAARHPDLFVGAGSFSGALDVTNGVELVVIWGSGLFGAGNANAIFGPYNNTSIFTHDAQQLNYRNHNPVDLAENLRPVDLALFVGTAETDVNTVNHTFRDTLLGLGIDHGWQERQGGEHAWVYWNQYFALWLPRLMGVFANPPPLPPRWSYKSADADYGAHGWRVQLTRAVSEFSRLSVDGANGFTLTGSGSAQVTTGPLFAPGASYSVTVTRSGGSETYTVSADASGQIATRPFLLGPDNAYQQFSGGTTNVYTATVTIARL